MKRTHKTKLLILILCFYVNNIFAQALKDIFDPQFPITYLGVDYTHVLVFGHQDGEVMDLVDRQFRAINQVILDEPKKYDLKKAFKRDSIPNDLSFVTEKNKTIVDTAIASKDLTNVFHLSNSDIASIVKSYNFGDKKGIGFLFIMESLNKKDERGSMYCTFVDMANRKVLLTERLTEKPSGFGLRNYWAHTIYEAIDDIKDKKFEEWARNK